MHAGKIEYLTFDQQVERIRELQGIQTSTEFQSGEHCFIPQPRGRAFNSNRNATMVTKSNMKVSNNKNVAAPEAVDSDRTAGHQFVKNLVADVKNVAGVIPVLGSLGKLIGIFDRPSKQEDPTLNVSVSDVEIPVQSLGFRYADYRSDASAITQDTSWDGSLLPLLKVPGRIAIGTWSTVNAAGELFFNIPVSPCFCIESGTTTVTRENTPMSYYSDMFSFWRGSIEYEIEVIASGFHQGQLFICYTPGSTEYTNLPDVTNMQSVTMDIALSRNVSFTVPWMSSADYKCCVDQKNPEFLNANRPYVNGVFSIFIQNPLAVQSDTITNEVEVNVYIKAGDDFELRDPRVPTVDALLLGDRRIPNGSIDYAETNPTVAAEPTEFQSGEMAQHGAMMQAAVVDDKEEYSESTDSLQEFLGRSNMGGKQMINSELVGRTFRLGTGNINLTNARFDQLYVADIPNALFEDTNLSIHYVSQVAYLANFDVEFIIKIQPTQFHQGSIIMWFQPYGYGDQDDTSISTGSYQSFRHAKVNLGGTTEASFIAPFASAAHCYEKGSIFNQGGSLYVNVWNVLNAATSSSQSLTFTIWFRLVDPVFKVATVPTEWQSGEMESSTVETAVIECDKTEGYLREDHMNLYRYFDRPSRIAGYEFNGNNIVLGLDYYGFSHLYAGAGFAFHSGSNRISLIGNASKFDNWSFFVTYLTQGSNGYFDVSNLDDWRIVTPGFLPSLRSGKSFMWRPQEKNGLTLDLYQYASLPTLNTKIIEGPTKYTSRSGYVAIVPKNIPTDKSLLVDVYHTRDRKSVV